MNTALARLTGAGETAPDGRLTSPFARDVLAGLEQPQKTIACTWLYDRRGSELFDDITRLQAYYPTRAETALLQQHAADLARAVGAGVCLIELGAGSLTKTRLVLEALQAPRAYLPIDISADFMLESLARLKLVCPGLPCIPVVADFTSPQALSDALALCPAGARQVVFFPGSTIGNLTRPAAQAFLRLLARTLADDALLAIGVDATRDVPTLAAAYDDPEGVTAAFNLNLLVRINRELEGTFDLQQFVHQARVNQTQQRVEMHLLSCQQQTVEVLGRRFAFRQGETIHTENSHKYGVQRFEDLAASAGWRTEALWRAGQHGFEFHLLALD